MIAFIKKWLLRLFLIMVSVLALVIAVENSSEVVITVLSYPVPSLPISWLVILAFVFGFAMASLLSCGYIFRARLRNREIEKQVSAAKYEIDRLKAASSE